MANPSLFLCFSSHGVFVNAHLPICSESPLKSTSVNFPHKPNELVSIFFTVDGIVTFSKLSHPVKQSPPIDSTPSSIITSVKFSQPLNDMLLIFFTEPGITTLVILSLLKNSCSLISVTSDGISTSPDISSSILLSTPFSI